MEVERERERATGAGAAAKPEGDSLHLSCLTDGGLWSRACQWSPPPSPFILRAPGAISHLCGHHAVLIVTPQKILLTGRFLDIPLMVWSIEKKNFLTVKTCTKKSCRRMYTCFGCETKTGIVRILVIFQHRRVFSHINVKLSPRPSEWYDWTYAYLEK